MSELPRTHEAHALRAIVRTFVAKAAVGLREVYLDTCFKARCAKVGLWVVFSNSYDRLANAAQYIALPIRRPFLFLANLCAELGVLFLKAEGYFLKLEKARLEIDRKSSIDRRSAGPVLAKVTRRSRQLSRRPCRVAS